MAGLSNSEAVDKMVDLYQPFVHDNQYIFVSEALFAAPIVEPEFDCDPRNISWREYWLDVHVPGLRKWCFPLFENKTPPGYTPRHAFKLPRPQPPAAPQAPTSPQAPASSRAAHPELGRTAAHHTEV